VFNEPPRNPCLRCGAPLVPDARFCTVCGAPAGLAAYGVPTIELAGTRYELASFWRRVAASIIDALITSPVIGAAYAVVLWDDLQDAYQQLFDPAFPEPYFEGFVYAFSPQGRLDMVLLTFALTAFGVALEAYGWTPAKALLGIRVRREDGRRPGWVHGFVRAQIKVLSYSLLIGVLWAAWDTRRQTWHDKFAHTFVVRVSPLPADQPAEPPTTPTPTPVITSRRILVWVALCVLWLAYLSGANYLYGTWVPGSSFPSTPPTRQAPGSRTSIVPAPSDLVRLIDVRDARPRA
jgi:uncharacterized RDD family membrane protein YckC